MIDPFCNKSYLNVILSFCGWGGLILEEYFIAQLIGYISTTFVS